MTIHRWRLSSAERLLGLEGPPAVCPSCSGSGTTWPADGEHTRWELDKAFAEVARRLGVEFPDAGDEPTDGQQVACGRCRGAGVVAKALAEAFGSAQTAASSFEADLMRVATTMNAVEYAGVADDGGTPGLLRAVDNAKQFCIVDLSGRNPTAT